MMMPPCIPKNLPCSGLVRFEWGSIEPHRVCDPFCPPAAVAARSTSYAGGGVKGCPSRTEAEPGHRPCWVPTSVLVLPHARIGPSESARKKGNQRNPELSRFIHREPVRAGQEKRKAAKQMQENRFFILPPSRVRRREAHAAGPSRVLAVWNEAFARQLMFRFEQRAMHTTRQARRVFFPENGARGNSIRWPADGKCECVTVC
ncbi:hypothetical protein ZHAS_00006657 [Anopheles sinensis]|uniref:Uncharacterized protein n=1 Tax=Anopheles sinensis TaxID=74873 RepID=A0A084VMV9_ANOSI|nr:hypothetical protein ZHAS_00006657 [Anopheles sinensis]